MPANSTPLLKTGRTAAGTIPAGSPVTELDVLATRGQAILGFNQQSVTAGQRMTVVCAGSCEAWAGETIADGALLQVGDNGTVVTRTTGELIGRALNAATVGDKVEVLLSQIHSPVSGGGISARRTTAAQLGVATDKSGALTVEDPLFSPTELANCELWLDAKVGVCSAAWTTPADGAAVTTWLDGSGNARHATVSSGTPIYSATGGLGGNPGITGGRMVTPGFLTAGMGSGGWTMFVVSKASAFSGQKIKVHTGTVNVWDSYNGTTGNRDITIAGLTGFSQSTAPAPRPDGVDMLRVSPTAVSMIVGDSGNSSQCSNAVMSTTISAAATAWSTSALYIGDASFGGYAWPGTISAVLFYSRALTDDEVRRVYAYLVARYETLPMLCLLGNSLTSGTGSTSGAGQALTAAGDNLPGLLKAALGSTARVMTDAYPGRTGRQIIDESPAYSGVMNTPRTVSLVCEGTNSLATGSSVGLAYEHLARVCRMRAGAGRRVAVGTVMYRGDSGNDAKNRALTDQLNALIRANYQTFADALVDYAADPRLQDFNNATYFAPDKIHLTSVGYGVARDIALPVVTVLLSQV